MTFVFRKSKKRIGNFYKHMIKFVSHVSSNLLVLNWALSIQLQNEMRKGTVFTDWEEGALNFAPTYKYNPNSNEYDTSEKRRVPAWCDRILHRPTPLIKRLNYDRHEFTISDHRPVTSYFNIEVRHCGIFCNLSVCLICNCGRLNQ